MSNASTLLCLRRLLPVALALTGLPARADEPLPNDDHRTVITAEGVRQRLFEAPRAIDALDAETLRERQPRSLSEALGEMPGVAPQQTNRGAGAPMLRGMIGPDNVLVIDGIRFQTSTFRTGPNQYLALLSPYAIDRIEVVRGPSSVLHGDGALGGVIHLFTPAAPDPRGPGDLRAGVRGRLSSADWAEEGAVSLGGVLGPVGLSAGLSFHGFGELRTGGGARVPLSAFEQVGWRGRTIVRLSTRWVFEASYLGNVVTGAGRVDQLGKGDIQIYDNLDHVAWTGIRFDGRKRDVVQGARVAARWHRLGEGADRFRCVTDKTTGIVQDPAGCEVRSPATLTEKRRYDDTVDVVGGLATVDLAAWDGRVEVHLGAEADHERVSSSASRAKADGGFVFKPEARGNFSDGSTYDRLGLFGHVRAPVASLGPRLGELRVSGGLRGSHVAARAGAVPGVGDVRHDDSGLVGSAGVQLLAPRSHTLWLSVLQGFRAPNLQEATVLGDTGSKFEVPNAALSPARSLTLEAGARLDAEPVRASCAAFRTLLSDLIDEAPSIWNGEEKIGGKPVIQRVNSSVATYDGVEAALAGTVGPVTISAHATWLRGQTRQSSGTSQPARRVPPLFGRLGARWSRADGRAYVELFARSAARQDRLHASDASDLRICETRPYSGALRSPCDGTPAWVTLNARAGWRFVEGLRADLAVYNVTDSRYREHGSGVDAPGLDVRASLSASY